MQSSDLPIFAGAERLFFLDVSGLKPIGPYNFAVHSGGKACLLPPPAAFTIERHSGEIVLWHWTAAGEPQTHSHPDGVEEAFSVVSDIFGADAKGWIRVD